MYKIVHCGPQNGPTERVRAACHYERMHPEMKVQTIAAEQGGVITRSQALSAGMTDRQIGYRLSTARWSRLSFGGYRTLDMHGRRNLLRAAISVLPGGVASHGSAAALHTLSHVDTRLVSVSVHASSTHDFPGVLVHRTRDLAHAHVMVIDGMATTSVARSIVDLAAITHPQRFHAIVSDAIANKKTSASEIDQVLTHVARRGKPGVVAARRELEKWIGTPIDASALERAGFRLLKCVEVEEWTTEYPIPWSANRRFDVAFPNQQIAIEWDSRRWHTLAKAFESDRQRDTKALAHGWRILRFTWDDVHDRPDYVIGTLKSVLALAD
jgi:hypothetical protein